MAGIFGEVFVVSVSQETKFSKYEKSQRKLRSKIRNKIRVENSKNSVIFRSAPFQT